MTHDTGSHDTLNTPQHTKDYLIRYSRARVNGGPTSGHVKRRWRWSLLPRLTQILYNDLINKSFITSFSSEDSVLRQSLINTNIAIFGHTSSPFQRQLHGVDSLGGQSCLPAK